MKLVSKAAAFAAAAALSTTGLVAAAGTSANAVDAKPTYTCSTGMTPTTFNVPLEFSMPKVVEGEGIASGTKVPASASLGDLVAKALSESNPTGDAVFAALLAKVKTAAESADSSVTASTTGFTVTVPALNNLRLPFALFPETLRQADIANVLKTASLPIDAGFTNDVPAALPAGTYDLKLADSFKLTLGIGDASIEMACDGKDGKPVIAKFVVSPKATTSTGDSAALTAAKAKLAKDTKALKAAKKAFKKAKGHKKVVLKKKIAKLQKAIKMDKMKIASLSK